MARSGFVLVATLLISAPSLALAALPDRSTLSYEENVTINTACAGPLKRGDSAFADCVRQQLGQLEKHPSPDRSALTAEKNQAIESKCSYLRRTSIGDYNDCLTKAMEAPAPEQAAEASDDALGKRLETETDYARVFTQDKPSAAKEKAEPAEKPEVMKVSATDLALPATVLPKRIEPASGAAMNAQEVFKKVERSIFVVVATPSLADAKSRNFVTGSAVAVTEHLLLTNCHVVKGRPVIKIVQNDQATDAELVAGKMGLDRCVLRADSIKLEPVRGVRSFDNLAVGEHVYAVGAPFRLEHTLSEGLISSLHPRSGVNLVQTSAPVSPGSSGGGLFDDRGNLIGITTLASSGRAQNINFAIAASDYWN